MPRSQERTIGCFLLVGTFFFWIISMGRPRLSRARRWNATFFLYVNNMPFFLSTCGNPEKISFFFPLKAEKYTPAVLGPPLFFGLFTTPSAQCLYVP